MNTIVNVTLTILFIIIGAMVWLFKTVILSMLVSIVLNKLINNMSARETLDMYKHIAYDVRYMVIKAMGRK